MNYAAFTHPLWQWLLPLQEWSYNYGRVPMLPDLPSEGPSFAMWRLVEE
jgi:hypothetical protein